MSLMNSLTLIRVCVCIQFWWRSSCESAVGVQAVHPGGGETSQTPADGKAGISRGR